jgi:hypothetical protein
LVIRFISYLYTQLVTTSNYSVNTNSHTPVYCSTYEVFSICCIFTGCRMVTTSNDIAFSAPCSHPSWSLTASQLTPRLAAISLTSYSSRNRSCTSLYSLEMNCTENTILKSSVLSQRYYMDHVEDTLSSYSIVACCESVA